MRVRASTGIAIIPGLSRLLQALSKARRKLMDELTGSYRPEKYYMRGPGPKWRQKSAHGPAGRSPRDTTGPR